MNWKRVRSNLDSVFKRIALGLLVIFLVLIGMILELFAQNLEGTWATERSDIGFSMASSQEPPASFSPPYAHINAQIEELPAVQGIPNSDYSSETNYPDSIYYYSRKNVNLSPNALPGKNPPPRSPGLIPVTDPLLSQQLSDGVLNQAPDRQTRTLIERARQNELDTQRGVDTTAERWTTVKDSRITWGGRILGDWVNWMNDSQLGGQPNYVEFRQLRLFAAGEGYGVYDFKLEFDFAPENEVDAPVVNNRVQASAFGLAVKDAYVGLKDIPIVGYLRFGHFKVPFGLEELASTTDITFLERSLPDVFTPRRQLGVAAYNQTQNQNLSWSYGVFFYEFDESARVIQDDNQGVRAATRLVWTPYYDEPSDGRYLFHSGIGYSYARPRLIDDPNTTGAYCRLAEFRSRPEIDRGSYLIDTGELDVQQYNTLDTELAWVNGSLSIQSEMMWTGLNETDGANANLYGAYVYLSYFLTGEHRHYDRRFGVFDRVIPYENFWMVRTPHGARAGRGAWEATVRWSYLDFAELNGQQLQDVTAGFNWYWNPNTRMMFNWIHTFAHQSPVDPGGDAGGDVFAMRMQVDF